MDTIQTINGVMHAKDVRLICPHEHLIVDGTHEAITPDTVEEQRLFNGPIEMHILGLLRRNPYIVKCNLVLDDVDVAINELAHVQRAGSNLLIDVTSIGVGRDINKLNEISCRSNMNIVVGCGLFTHDAIPTEYHSWTAEQIGQWMAEEISHGIGSTKVKPGVIGEIGVSEKIYPVEERSLIGAASASVQTGLPVYLHTYPWSRAGLNAVDILIENGVSPHRICVCHLDVTFDMEYLELMLKKRVYVEFDNFGKEFYFESQEGAFAGGPFETDVTRVRTLKRLISEGYGPQLLLANDVCQKVLLRKYGGWGYDHIFTNIIPMMRMEGIETKDIDMLISQNPLDFLFCMM